MIEGAVLARALTVLALVSSGAAACATRTHGSADAGAIADAGVIADAGADLDPDAALGPYGCNPTTGLGAPMSDLCSVEQPCTGLFGEAITTPSVVPTCAGGGFADGPPRAWVDAAGATHYACVIRPPGAGPGSPRPLIVHFHGAFGTADGVYGVKLRAKAAAYDLSGDPTSPGFVLVVVQGRNLRSVTGTRPDGSFHDHYHRDLASPSQNPDVDHVDRLIDELVAEGVVDGARVYVMGHSNGGHFAQMYAIARHATATPGGNRVAASVIYSAADPFANLAGDPIPSCALDPYPVSTVPIFLLSRDCDGIPCDAAQAADLGQEGWVVDPGWIVPEWMSALATRVADPNATWQILRGDGTPTSACLAPAECDALEAGFNHLHWPDGVSDGSGIDHEPAMLDFLRANPLP
jgi:dienelactone hydrolase